MYQSLSCTSRSSLSASLSHHLTCYSNTTSGHTLPAKATRFLTCVNTIMKHFYTIRRTYISKNLLLWILINAEDPVKFHDSFTSCAMIFPNAGGRLNFQGCLTSVWYCELDSIIMGYCYSDPSDDNADLGILPIIVETLNKSASWNHKRRPKIFHLAKYMRKLQYLNYTWCMVPGIPNTLVSLFNLGPSQLSGEYSATGHWINCRGLAL